MLPPRHPERRRPKGAVVEGPFLPMKRQKRSLHSASLRSAPVGMTGFESTCDGPARHTGEEHEKDTHVVDHQLPSTDWRTVS